MTITYEYEDALYVNLTNKCNCNCEFCLRHGRKEGSIYTEDSLWLEREPTRKEALDSFLSRDVCSYREIVFCGYGEPTYRLDDILWLVDQLKERFGRRLPPVRINTNGHANLILGAGRGARAEGPHRHSLHLPQCGHCCRIYGSVPSCSGRGGLSGYAGLCPGGHPVCPPCGAYHCGQGQELGGDRDLQADRR